MEPAIARDIARVERLSAVPTVLRLVSEITGLRFVAVARVTSTSWTACAVLDQIGFGLTQGDQLDIDTTFCKEIHASNRPIVIEKASEDEEYRGHPIPKMYGFESYIAVPIVLNDGSVFGTICALDRQPATLRDNKILSTVELFAQLIGAQLQVEDQLDESRTALAGANEAGLLQEHFISLLGHDLRNPLFSLMSGLRLLSTSQQDERSSFVLDHMQQSCARMGKLIDDMLDFTRGRLGGGIPIERRAVDDLDQHLEAVAEEFRQAHPEHAVHVRLDIAQDVVCDPVRLAQLLSNLLSAMVGLGANDQPFTVEGTASEGRFELKVAHACLVVPPETLAQFFQPYARQSDRPVRAGRELGLYIAAEIARAHDGVLTATSTLEEGTGFRFVCPTT